MPALSRPDPQLAARLTERVRLVELGRRRRLTQQISRLAQIHDPLSYEWATQSIRWIISSQNVSARQATAYLNAYVEALGGRSMDLTEALQVNVGYDGPVGRSVAHVRKRGERLVGIHGQREAQAWTSRQGQRVAADLAWTAFRDTLQAGVDMHDQVVGYRRIASPLACGACLALATSDVLPPGTAFRDHPYCRCSIEPVVEGADLVRRPSGKDMFDAMPPEEQDRRFGRAKAELLRSGEIDFSDLISKPRTGIGRRPLVTETPLHRLQPE